MSVPLLTVADLKRSREAFEQNEPRDLFYRVATELVQLTLNQRTSLSLAEALAVLLQTWNSSFYRFWGKFDSQHFRDIEQLLTEHASAILLYRSRAIESLVDADRDTVQQMFHGFEEILGPVGAAKCLHLLAPRFFPLWDRAIASNYRLALQTKGANSDRYYRFMQLSQRQCIVLGGEKAMGKELLKAIDEYNYCKFTGKWI